MAITTLGAIALGASALGGVASSAIGAGAARSAGAAQERAAQLGVDEQRRQFDAMRELLSPYVKAGDPALQAIMGAAGLLEPGSQQAFADQQSQSPMFQALARQGEDAILQNASATGGLRGGNVQGALGQFRPALLNQFIEQQYGRLSGIAQMGQNSAAGVVSAGMQTGDNIANLFGQHAAGQAGARPGVANSINQGIGGFTNALNSAFGMQQAMARPPLPGRF